MIGDGLALCALTIGVLLVPGLAGWWALAPFERDDRPYLWLAAPLAGLASLSLALCVLFFGCGLTIPICLTLGLVFLCALSALVVARRGGILGRDWSAATATFVASSAWCAVTANWSAIKCGEPTLFMMHGTDMIGYAQYADWMLRHPHEAPVGTPDQPGLAFVDLLHQVDTRFGAFGLLAAAAWMRGTTAIFSYDWFSGVGLAAGILAFVGAFASSRRDLLLLLAAACVSLWFAFSRTGFLGKTLCYPCCLLLAWMFLSTWSRPTILRLLTATLLAIGAGLLHSNLTLAAVMALVLGGGLVGCAVEWCRNIGNSATRDAMFASARKAGVGLGICLALSLPINAWFLFRKGSPPLHDTLDWLRLFEAALDLNFIFCPLNQSLYLWMTAGAIGASMFLALVALWRRDYGAASFLACIGVLPAAWLLGLKHVYQFTGLLFPLTVAGAVLALQGIDAVGRGSKFGWATLTLVLALIGLRIPQAASSYHEYGFVSPKSRFVYRQSEVTALVAEVGSRTVDVQVAHVQAGLLLLVEFEFHGVRAQYREPAWTNLLSYKHWPAPDYAARGDFLLRDAGAGNMSERAVLCGEHYRLDAGPEFARRAIPASLIREDRSHP